MKYLLALFLVLLPVSVNAETPKPVSVFVIEGEVTQNTAVGFHFFLDAARSANSDLAIIIDSPGGDADAGLDMYNALRKSGLRSKCVVPRFAASAAFLILQGCDVRLAVAGAQLVTHRAKQVTVMRGELKETDGQLAAIQVELTPEELQELTAKIMQANAHLIKLALEFDSIIAARMGLSLGEYLKKVSDGKAWEMTAAEAAAAHAVDGVLDVSH